MIGKTIDIIVTSVLQTTAGKMIFGRYVESVSAVQPSAPAPGRAGQVRVRIPDLKSATRMNRNRRLAWLFRFSDSLLLRETLGGEGCDVCGGPPIRGAPPLDIMQQHSVMRREVNWASLRAQTFQRSLSALNPVPGVRHDPLCSVVSWRPSQAG